MGRWRSSSLHRVVFFHQSKSDYDLFCLGAGGQDPTVNSSLYSSLGEGSVGGETPGRSHPKVHPVVHPR